MCGGAGRQKVVDVDSQAKQQLVQRVTKPLPKQEHILVIAAVLSLMVKV